MYFPLELPLGKHIPLYGSIPGRSFRLRRHPETTSQSECGFRDVLSAWAAIGKACPGLRCQGVFFTPAPCIEFDSPRVWDSVDVAHGRLGFDNIASISGRGFARRIREHLYAYEASPFFLEIRFHVIYRTFFDFP